MVPKGSMQAGDPAIYIEIDSLVPLDNKIFSFCERYHGKIKTQKFKNPDGSQFWSQGLLMAAKDFGWTIINKIVIDDENKTHAPGIVFRSQDGTKSFKAVSNEFLAKYHG